MDLAIGVELAGGHVHGGVDGVPSTVPDGHLAARLSQDPPPDRDDEPGLLEEGDERVCSRTLDGMAPAEQRLDPADVPVGEVDDRLVDVADLEEAISDGQPAEQLATGP